MPKGGTRTLKVTYVEDLSVSVEGALYFLPLKLESNLKSCSLNMQVDVTDAETPVFESATETLPFPSFCSSETLKTSKRYELSFQGQESFNKGFAVKIPQFQQSVILERVPDD